jgi:hypothetical protein
VIEGPLAVQIEVYPPDNRRRDIDNLQKALLDAMQHGGAYGDDSQIVRLAIEKRDCVLGGRTIVHIAGCATEIRSEDSHGGNAGNARQERFATRLERDGGHVPEPAQDSGGIVGMAGPVNLVGEEGFGDPHVTPRCHVTQDAQEALRGKGSNCPSAVVPATPILECPPDPRIAIGGMETGKRGFKDKKRLAAGITAESPDALTDNVNSPPKGLFTRIGR